MKTTIEKLIQYVSAQLAAFNATDKPTLVMEHGTATTAKTSALKEYAAKHGGKIEIRRMPAGDATPLLGNKAEIERMQSELRRILGNA